MIQLEQVTKTYQGQDGCACGCRGDYAVPVGKKEADYDVESDRKVKRRLAIINANFADCEDGRDAWGGVEYCNPANGRITRVYCEKEA